MAKYNKKLFDSLLKDWLNFIRADVKPSTYSRYKTMIDRHIRPNLGEIPVSELTSRQMDLFRIHLQTSGNLKKPGGLSPKTVTGILSVVRLALNYGADRGYDCPDHIAVQNPRLCAPEIQILTFQEQQKLEQALFQENSPVSFGILISLYLGLRIGEVCALRWEDFDMENGLLHVQRSMQRIPNLEKSAADASAAKTKIVVDKPKTSCSLRKIPIPSFLLPVFQQHKKADNSYIVTGSASHLEPRGFYRKYKKIMKTCDLEHFNYHALRHTFATRCVENNFDIKSLSEILGHANISMTLQRYVHPSVSLKRQHMDRLGAIAVYGQNSVRK